MTKFSVTMLSTLISWIRTKNVCHINTAEEARCFRCSGAFSIDFLSSSVITWAIMSLLERTQTATIFWVLSVIQSLCSSAAGVYLMRLAFSTESTILIFRLWRIWAVSFTPERRAAADSVFAVPVYITFAQVFDPDLFSLLILLIRA